ncbi:hypothetical protein [Dactylosporangium darangshiense]|uniref:Uncharacterized protein n=1 Tax=Dactylosporangium darangshiense TaxID=579108 RepID=A0ABP8D8X1_9ACTN
MNLRTGEPSEAALRSAVRRVLGEPSYRERAAAIRDDVARHDGPADACVLIERLARTGAPVLRC